MGTDVSTLIFNTIVGLVGLVIPSIIMTVILIQGARYNRRRHMATRRDPTADIYPQQPLADIQEFSLPMTITLYPKVQMWIGMALISGVAFAGVLAGVWLLLNPSRIWAGILGIICLYLFVWFMITIFKQPIMQITLTETGIQISQFCEEKSIEWKDARLFSIFAVRRHGDNIHYELSSERRILRWNWDRSLHGLRPTTSPEEYNRQMEAILSFIAAKTGLPLYDLRSIPTYGIFFSYLSKVGYVLFYALLGLAGS